MKSLWIQLSVLSLLLFTVMIHGWGYDGHFTICRIAQVSVIMMLCIILSLLLLLALIMFGPKVDKKSFLNKLILRQSRLSKAATNAVEKLLSDSAENELGSIFMWADNVKF